MVCVWREEGKGRGMVRVWGQQYGREPEAGPRTRRDTVTTLSLPTVSPYRAGSCGKAPRWGPNGGCNSMGWRL